MILNHSPDHRGHFLGKKKASPPLRVPRAVTWLTVHRAPDIVRLRAVLARMTVWNEKVGATKGSLAPSPGITLRGEGAPTVHTPPLRVKSRFLALWGRQVRH